MFCKGARVSLGSGVGESSGPHAASWSRAGCESVASSTQQQNPEVVQ